MNTHIAPNEALTTAPDTIMADGPTFGAELVPSFPSSAATSVASSQRSGKASQRALFASTSSAGSSQMEYTPPVSVKDPGLGDIAQEAADAQMPSTQILGHNDILAWLSNADSTPAQAESMDATKHAFWRRKAYPRSLRVRDHTRSLHTVNPSTQRTT